MMKQSALSLYRNLENFKMTKERAVIITCMTGPHVLCALHTSVGLFYLVIGFSRATVQIGHKASHFCCIMEISNKIQFVQRTKDILTDYDGKYEVTLLINAAIGLLFCGNEANTCPQMDICSINTTGWKSSYIDRTTNSTETLTIDSLTRHVRNSIAHNKFEFLNENRLIKGVKFFDINPRTSESCEFEISIDGLRTLALKVGEAYIQHMQANATNN